MPTGTINVQLPPLELKILFAILSCWAYRQWGNNISVTGNGYGVSMEYPITFANKALAVIPYDINGDWTDSAIPYVHAAWYPGEGSDRDDRRWARVGFSEKSSLFGAYRYIAIGK